MRRSGRLLATRGKHACLMEDTWMGVLLSPISPLPPRARRKLMETNFLGNWNFMNHFVHENLYENGHTTFFYMYRWIMAAACHPNVDPAGQLEAHLSTKFSLSYLQDIPSPHSDREQDFFGLREMFDPWWVRSGNRPFELPLERAPRDKLAIRTPRLRSPWYRMFGHISDHQFINNQVFPRRDWAHNPRLDFDLSSMPPRSMAKHLESFTKPLVDPSPDDDECIICRENFIDISGITPNVCRYAHHLDCLASWFQRGKGDDSSEYKFCLCMQIVCTYTDLDQDEEIEASFWQNSQAYLVEREENRQWVGRRVRHQWERV